MLVSVVVCTHSLDDYPNLAEAVDSLLEQTHREIEIVVVVDGNEELHQRMLANYGSQEAVKTIPLKQNVGLCGARNAGIKEAQGDAIAFLDDDAVAERSWVENLMATYQELDAIAVGGKILPLWLGQRPDYLPEELYWLVGVTHEGFAEEKVTQVRNTFGPNMSFRRGVFQKVGLFNENLGFARRGTSYMQGEEAEFTLRIKQKLGQGVLYNPKALVYHKIPPSKVKVKALLKRAFYQGYSKALLRKLNPSADSIATERAYLKSLLLKYIPKRLRSFFLGSAHLNALKQLLVLVASIFSVGLGFLYGYTKRI